MQISDITVFDKETNIKKNEYGSIWSKSKEVLKSLATPVGRKFCNTARYSKNRELSEKWLDIRNKWVTVLERIDPEINADNLPWENELYLFSRSFNHNNQVISFFINKKDAVSAMKNYNYRMYDPKRSFVYWDAERQDFDLVLTVCETA